MGVTGQSLPPKNDFEHARGLRNSAYAVNLTYETYRHTYTYVTVPGKRNHLGNFFKIELLLQQERVGFELQNALHI